MNPKIQAALEAELLRRLDDPNVSAEVLGVALEYVALPPVEDRMHPNVADAFLASIGATHH